MDVEMEILKVHNFKEDNYFGKEVEELLYRIFNLL